MESEGFWHLVPRPGAKVVAGRTITSLSKLQECYITARLDDELFALLIDPAAREKLRAALIATYFSQEVRPAVAEQGAVNIEASEYGRRLLEGDELEIQGEQAEEGNGHRKRVRDQGFRKVIMSLYRHRCSLCGLRMLTPDGHTAVEGAHIRPWCESRNDHPTNGLALCRLCHWAFDEGMMSIGSRYEVLISPLMKGGNNFPGHIPTLSDRGIFKSEPEEFWPCKEGLGWHRRTVLRR